MTVTPNRRILLNIVATYGRSLYALIVGLFCGRWMLMALGEVDYGLLGVVGGLAVFVSYLDILLAGAIERFFAIAVGERKTNPEKGIETGRMWFTTALVIQTIWPTILLTACYPIGEWTVRHYLTIPPDKIEACVWIWRFVSFSSYLRMLTMPFNAMYGAHQYMAELTIYSVATTTLMATFLFYCVTHPGVWLVRLSFWQCLLQVIPNIVIAIRACFLFPECRIVKRHLKCWHNIRIMAKFALWTAIGWLGTVLRGQGIAILVNKVFGPRVNAGVVVGTNLSSHCNTLGGSIIGAFSPAIYNAWGANEYDNARNMAYRTCKIGTLLILVFSIPLSLEVNEVLRLWLKTPPRYAAEICLFVMTMTIIDKMAIGHMICVNANGDVAKYQMFLGSSLILTLPLAWLLIKCGLGVYSIGWALVTTMAVCAFGRVWFARRLVSMSARYWLWRIFAPLVLVIILTLGVGLLPKMLLPPSFLRVLLTTVIVELVLLPLAWFLVLNPSERAFVLEKICLLASRWKKSS